MSRLSSYGSVISRAQGLRILRDWVVLLAKASRLYSGGQRKVTVVLIFCKDGQRIPRHWVLEEVHV